MITNPNEGAFPGTLVLSPNGGWYDHPDQHVPGISGLTKREHFAALIMAAAHGCSDFSEAKAGALAQMAVESADALIAELNKPAK